MDVTGSFSVKFTAFFAVCGCFSSTLLECCLVGSDYSFLDEPVISDRRLGLFQALMVWDVSVSPPILSKSLLNSHRDWITGCVWTADCVVKLHATSCHCVVKQHLSRLLQLRLFPSRSAPLTMAGSVCGTWRPLSVSERFPGGVRCRLCAVW